MRYPGYTVSGPQSAFLLEYYRKAGEKDPVAAYNDFLTAHLRMTNGENIATTLSNWINAQEIGETGFDAAALIQEFGLIKSPDGITLIPMEDFAQSAVKLNNVLVSDFSNIPLISLKQNVRIEVLHGVFEIQRTHNGVTSTTTLFPKSRVFVNADQGLDYEDGPLWTTSPITLRRKLATLSGSDLNCYVAPEEEDVLVYVLGGTVNLVSEKGNRDANVLEYLKMNKKGQIKKAKKIDQEVLPVILQQVKKKYRIVDPFIAEDPVKDQVGMNRE